MNELDYASLEASKRLYKAGIVIETEVTWCNYGKSWELGYAGLVKNDPVGRDFIPAPTMAEVWRELPENTMVSMYNQITHCFTDDGGESHNINPTDALIDLLIRVRRKPRNA